MCIPTMIIQSQVGTMKRHLVKKTMMSTELSSIFQMTITILQNLGGMEHFVLLKVNSRWLCSHMIFFFFNFYPSLFRDTTSRPYYGHYDDDLIKYNNELDEDLPPWKKTNDDVSNDIGWKPFSDSPKNLERAKVGFLINIHPLGFLNKVEICILLLHKLNTGSCD